MDTIAQHPRDLRLLVQASGPPPSGLTVLSERHIAIAANLRLTLRVIGESHWVTLAGAGRRLDEVLACYQPHLPGALYGGAIPPAGELEVRAGGYGCRVWAAPLDGQVEAAGRGPAMLELRFPHPHGGRELPFTRLWWERDPSGRALTWHSIHCYALPGGDLAVRSQTRLDLRRWALAGLPAAGAVATTHTVAPGGAGAKGNP